MIKKTRVFTDREIMKLLENPNIVSIKNKSQIVYSNEFKYLAVLTRLTHPERTAREIFMQFGFDMNILNERTPQRRLCLWLKQYNKFGERYFLDSITTYKTIHRKSIDATENDFHSIMEDLKNIIEEIEKCED